MTETKTGYWVNCIILEPSIEKGKEDELVPYERNVYCGKATNEEEAKLAVVKAHGERLVEIKGYTNPNPPYNGEILDDVNYEESLEDL